MAPGSMNTGRVLVSDCHPLTSEYRYYIRLRPLAKHVQSEADHEQDPFLLVVEAVADAAGVAPLELPPLYDAIDPDALNEVLTAKDSHAERSALFTFAGYDVAVTASGDVTVSPSE